MSNRKFLFFYLNTGNGHISPARVLKKALLEKEPNAQVELVNGFENKNIFGKLLFERLYRITSNYLTGAWTLIYDLSRFSFVQNLVAMCVRPTVLNYLKQKIVESGATDIVSFHFGLTPSLVSAIRELNTDIKLSCVVTDPFTLPKAWFYEKSVNYYVFSDRARDFAINECSMSADKVTVIPFLLDKKFRLLPSQSDIDNLREKHGFQKNKKIVLLAGGGDGLPHAKRIVNTFALRKVDFAVAVVCGRDKTAQSYMNVLAKMNPHLDLHVYGFVDFMDELISLSDCAVIKPGASTIMEVLLKKKPVIICRYIHGQELGNVEFALHNHVGFFIRKGADISRKIEEIFSDSEKYNSLKENLENLTLDTDSSKVADLILR